VDEEWRSIISAPDWGPRVAEALRRYFSEGRWLLAPVSLVSASMELDPDGTSVLLAIYDRAWSPKRIGLRRRLDREPMTNSEATPEESLAEQIAVYEISEPLGRYYDLLVEDAEGVWWWGDGFPDLSEHPDFRK